MIERGTVGFSAATATVLDLEKTVKMAMVEAEWGRPLDAQILEWLNEGKSLEVISGLCGVSRATLYRWLDRMNLVKEVNWGKGRGRWRTESGLAGRENWQETGMFDPVSGLYSRAYLNRVLVHECQRAQRSGRPLALIMAGLSSRAGVPEPLLRAAARIVVRHARKADYVARWDRCVFAVLAPDTGAAGAQRMVGRIRRTLERMDGQIHFTFGCGEYRSGQTPGGLVAAVAGQLDLGGAVAQ